MAGSASRTFSRMRSRLSAPRASAERYVELVNAGAYDTLHTLFAAHAVFLGPSQRELHGPEEISSAHMTRLCSC